MMRTFEGYRKGINLGGWISQSSLEKAHMDTFITEKDIEKIAGMGMDHVRLPIDFEVIEDEKGQEKPEGYQYIDNCISWCKKNRLHMILDLHKTAGYVFDDAENCVDFFHSKELQERFQNLWRRLSKRYGKEADMLAFEILNEVVDSAMKDIWNDLAEDTIRIIREHAKDTWILIGGTRNNSIVSIPELRKPYDDKIVFNFHCYEPLIFTHQAAYWVPGMEPDYCLDYPMTTGEYLEETRKHIAESFAELLASMDSDLNGSAFFMEYFKEAVAIAEKYDVPLYCGEYGVIDRADPKATLRWFKDINKAFEEYGIARAAWNYKEKDFGLTDEHYAEVFEEVIQYL